jgi:hypothetical protein
MARHTIKAPAAYEVGRGRPPRATQFKPGRSGNPAGRKKGSRNLKTILRRVMESEIEVSENGRKRRVPVVEALILRLVQEGLRGQLRALDSALDRYEQHVDDGPERQEELPEEDLALLERLMGTRARGASNRDQDDPALPGAETEEADDDR